MLRQLRRGCGRRKSSCIRSIEFARSQAADRPATSLAALSERPPHLREIITEHMPLDAIVQRVMEDVGLVA